MKYKIYILSLLFALTSCNAKADVATPTSTPISTQTPAPPTQTSTPTEAPTPTLPAEIDLASWIGLSADQKAEAYSSAPDVSPEGYTKGDLSTLHDYLTKYYQDGKLVGAYNHLANDFQTLDVAGIIEFDSAGTPIEMLSFADGDEFLDFVAKESVWYNESNISRFTVMESWLKQANPEVYEQFRQLRAISGFKSRFDLSLPLDDVNTNTDSFFQLFEASLIQPENSINGIVGVIKNRDGKFIAVFTGTDEATLRAKIEAKQFIVPNIQQ